MTTATPMQIASAASGRASEEADLPGFFLLIGLLIAAIVVLALILVAMRRRVLGRDDDAGGAGFLEQMRAMHARGELSDEEFELARRRMISRLKGEDPGPLPPGAGGVLVAEEGYDLTGEPLPRRDDVGSGGA